jgi:hypothetical protein
LSYNPDSEGLLLSKKILDRCCSPAFRQIPSISLEGGYKMATVRGRRRVSEGYM